jgi:hypothetical protein
MTPSRDLVIARRAGTDEAIQVPRAVAGEGMPAIDRHDE